MDLARLRRFFVRLLTFFRFNRAEDELAREITSHLALIEDEFRRKGMTPEKARLAARRAFGGVDQVKEAYRDASRTPWLADLGWDVRYAMRVLRQSPGFTVVAVAILAVGIGVNAAVFTVADAALFKGFRFVNRNDRLVYVYSGKDGGYSGVSYPDFDDWRARTRSFQDLSVIGDLKVLCDGNGSREVCFATRISWNGFRLLGLTPILGRDFTAADDRPGAAPVAILSYGFWERRFGKDPAVIGQTLRLGIADQVHQNGEGPPTTVPASTPLTTIIGVMPKGFAFPQDQDLWVPLVPMTPDVQQRDARNLWFAFGRLADGATRETAQADLALVGRQLATTYRRTNLDQVPRVETFTEFFLSRNASMIYGVLWAAVSFVLLIACANLANLLLARAAGRSREMSVRRALGAGRWRIVRQLLIESLVLSVAGGLCGWVLAAWGVRLYALATNPPVGQWNRDLLDYTTDVRALFYLVGISLGSGLLFGLAPALWFSRMDVRVGLRDGGGWRDRRTTRTTALRPPGERGSLACGGLAIGREPDDS